MAELKIDLEMGEKRLEECSTLELIAKINALKANNVQLRNIIAKQQTSKKLETQNEKRSFDFSKCKFRHVLLKFFYLGWDYQGFVTQEDTSNTIEHHLFEALMKTCLIKDRASSNYHRCGRTDKGVSSFSQVISIDLRSKSEDPENELNFCKILNRVLPDNIQVVAWCPVNDNFSARFDCKARTYKYFFPEENLHLDKMKIAANYLIGTHDFRNFCKMDVANGVVDFTRNIISVKFDCTQRDDDQDYSIFVITITGKAFLWHQIRSIMGILFLIGQNKEKPELILELLNVEKNPRKPAYVLADAVPLNLYDCLYDDVNWLYNEEAVAIAVKKLKNFWTLNAIKCTMVKSMILDLESQTGSRSLSECHIHSERAKNYIPIMKRQLCESLEDKIQHLKRAKMKLSTAEN